MYVPLCAESVAGGETCEGSFEEAHRSPFCLRTEGQGGCKGGQWKQEGCM